MFFNMSMCKDQKEQDIASSQRRVEVSNRNKISWKEKK